MCFQIGVSHKYYPVLRTSGKAFLNYKNQLFVPICTVNDHAINKMSQNC